MSADAALPDRIYHLALRAEWQEAKRDGVAYRRSTLGKSLDDEGFIHCSFASQVKTIADLLYRGREDVVLLAIDPAWVDSPIRVEHLDDGNETFPHIYGPLPVDAVVQSDEVQLGPDGRLAVVSLLETR